MKSTTSYVKKDADTLSFLCVYQKSLGSLKFRQWMRDKPAD